MKKKVSKVKVYDLFDKGYSPKEIAEMQRASVKEVLKILKSRYKINKEDSIKDYFLKKQQLKTEIIQIYRKHGFCDSLGILKDTL